MSDPFPVVRQGDEDAAQAQRDAARRLPLEDRFRQNDALSRFRIEALTSRDRPT